jgi:hypothetical protein
MYSNMRGRVVEVFAPGIRSCTIENCSEVSKRQCNYIEALDVKYVLQMGSIVSCLDVIQAEMLSDFQVP